MPKKKTEEKEVSEPKAKAEPEPKPKAKKVEVKTETVVVEVPSLDEEKCKDVCDLNEFLFALYCESESPTVRTKIKYWREMLDHMVTQARSKRED